MAPKKQNILDLQKDSYTPQFPSHSTSDPDASDRTDRPWGHTKRDRYSRQADDDPDLDDTSSWRTRTKEPNRSIGNGADQSRGFGGDRNRERRELRGADDADFADARFSRVRMADPCSTMLSTGGAKPTGRIGGGDRDIDESFGNLRSGAGRVPRDGLRDGPRDEFRSVAGMRSGSNMRTSRATEETESWRQSTMPRNASVMKGSDSTCLSRGVSIIGGTAVVKPDEERDIGGNKTEMTAGNVAEIAGMSTVAPPNDLAGKAGTGSSIAGTSSSRMGANKYITPHMRSLAAAGATVQNTRVPSVAVSSEKTVAAAVAPAVSMVKPRVILDKEKDVAKEEKSEPVASNPEKNVYRQKMMEKERERRELEDAKRRAKDLIVNSELRMAEKLDVERARQLEDNIKRLVAIESALKGENAYEDFFNSCLTNDEVSSLFPSVIAAKVMLAEAYVNSTSYEDVQLIVERMKPLLSRFFADSGVWRHKLLFLIELARISKELKSPRLSATWGLIEALFDALYTQEIIEEQYFIWWFEHTEDMATGSDIIFQVTNWMAWLNNTLKMPAVEDFDETEESEEEEEIDSHIPKRRVAF